MAKARLVQLLELQASLLEGLRPEHRQQRLAAEAAD